MKKLRKALVYCTATCTPVRDYIMNLEFIDIILTNAAIIIPSTFQKFVVKDMET